MTKLIKYLKPFLFSIVIVIVLFFIQSLAELYLPTLMSDIVNNGIAKSDNTYILNTGKTMILVALGDGICVIIANFIGSQVAIKFGKRLRSMIFTKAENFSLHEFDKVGTASMITRTTNDIVQVQQLLVMIMRMMISAPLMCIGGIILAAHKDAKLTLIFAVSLPLLIIVIGIFLLKGLPYFTAIQKKLDKLNLVTREGLTGIRVIRAFNNINKEKKKFNNANIELRDTSLTVNRIMAGLMPFMMVILNVTQLAVIWFGAIRIDSGSLQVGDMMAFIQYAMQIMFSFLMLAMMFIMIPRAEASAVRISEVLDMKPEIVDSKNTKNSGAERGYIEFKDVTFSYPGAEQPALNNISFSAKPGEITAIIGGTGSGKSTLINLIPRFYDIDSGSILVDGVDSRELSQKELRSKIGFVPQKAVLFTGTISDNIKFGNREASNDEVEHASKVAQAYDFITDMKDGFDSVIAQGGSNVSGGQKQRLSIARALVRRPEVYVFDDSFSALDFKTDAKLRAALKSETKQSTVIIVAQRISTVMEADRIIVLDEGRIVGMGTHRELLNSNEVYKEIASSQLSEEELA
ncbi:ATP-binding cassette, subfamily B [Clostridium acidisoli DSM 12555]|uniref:ATP-binding cassette, subfamily B n=1 Tax=Clostridium acidisoli DSM 12555 TaxID=1121291 RepID=A0A1W1XUJ9_9CLOT|nr:ABC transporter ATP-binding protein [Clostridium acidisoli]SMC27542.1 ATP-binding cassette, subfamily B [Clostridium acidisoli DSM 12555]